MFLYNHQVVYHQEQPKSQSILYAASSTIFTFMLQFKIWASLGTLQFSLDWVKCMY